MKNENYRIETFDSIILCIYILLTAICISFLATPKSTSSLTNNLFKAYFLLLLFTRKTTAKPPVNREHTNYVQGSRSDGNSNDYRYVPSAITSSTVTDVRPTVNCLPTKQLGSLEDEELSIFEKSFFILSTYDNNKPCEKWNVNR